MMAATPRISPAGSRSNVTLNCTEIRVPSFLAAGTASNIVPYWVTPVSMTLPEPLPVPGTEPLRDDQVEAVTDRFRRRVSEDAVPEAADLILPAVPANNPRPVTAEDLRRLLHAAWSGADPRKWI